MQNIPKNKQTNKQKIIINDRAQRVSAAYLMRVFPSEYVQLPKISCTTLGAESKMVKHFHKVFGMFQIAEDVEICDREGFCLYPDAHEHRCMLVSPHQRNYLTYFW